MQYICWAAEFCIVGINDFVRRSSFRYLISAWRPRWASLWPPAHKNWCAWTLAEAEKIWIPLYSSFFCEWRPLADPVEIILPQGQHVLDIALKLAPFVEETTMRVLSSLFEYHTGDTTSTDGEGDVFLRGNTPTAVPQYIPPPVEQHEYTVAVWVLSGLLVILSAVLVFVLVHIIFNHRRLRSMTLFPQRRQKAVQQRIDRRYETIEGWLISKRVQEHNDFCETCVREFAKFDGEDWIRTHSTMETAVVEESGSSDGPDNARVLVSKTIANKTPLEVESVHTKEKECKWLAQTE